MLCGVCKYWEQKTQKNQAFCGGLIHLTSILGVCNNRATMDNVHLVPNDNAINIIPHATIETDQSFGCIYYEPFDNLKPMERS
ncbi:MAG TPA: hypothetical protein DCF44_09455 [Chitinophagaceae bacterium]|nr:hypothetical protein [Chitinophagaceae bacterium]